MCFIGRLVAVAYQQDSCIPGYVADDLVDVEILTSALEEAIEEAFEVETPKPVLAEVWCLTTPNRTEYRLMLDGESYPLDNQVVRQIISEKSNVDWSQRFVKGEKNHITIAMFHTTTLRLDSLFHNARAAVEQIVPDFTMPNEDTAEIDTRPVRKSVELGPIQGPREIGIPLSPNLEFRYFWVDGREIRVHQSDKAEIARLTAARRLQ